MSTVYTYPLRERNINESILPYYSGDTGDDGFVIFQQTFLGASISQFALNLGFNGNSSTLNVSLVEDEWNLDSKMTANTVRDAITEGYHHWDPTAFPVGLVRDNGRQLGLDPFVAGDRSSVGTHVYRKGNNLNLPAGDLFWAPTPGEPVYFRYYDGARLSSTCVSNRTCANANTGDASTSPLTFEFNGILKSYKRDWSGSGQTYSVVVEDPRVILENTTVILDSFQGHTAPADAWYMDQHYHPDEKAITPKETLERLGQDAKFQRKFEEGYNGYYNVVNVFGYYEEAGGFGQSDTNEHGIPWFSATADYINAWGYKHNKGILPALDMILSGTMKEYIKDEEPYGGPLYYGLNSRPTTFGSSTSYENSPTGFPNNAGVHKYAIDLSPLYNLNNIYNPTVKDVEYGDNIGMGTVGDDFRIKGTKNLLQLIQEICTAAGADFFVDLYVPRNGTGNPVEQKLFDMHKHKAGIIRVIPIPKNADIQPGIIKTVLDQSLFLKVGPWANKIISADVGYEHTDPTTGMFTIGAPLTRVVGVSMTGGQRSKPSDNWRGKGKILGSRRREDFFFNKDTEKYFDGDVDPERDDVLIDSGPFLELDGAALQAYDTSFYNEAIWDARRSPEKRNADHEISHFLDYNADWGGKKGTIPNFFDAVDGRPILKDEIADLVDNDYFDARPIPIGRLTGALNSTTLAKENRADPFMFNIPNNKDVDKWFTENNADYNGVPDKNPSLKDIEGNELEWPQHPMDGYIDLFPAWGFTSKRFVQKAEFGQQIDMQTRGEPIMGMFHDDDPYRDFHPYDGLFGGIAFFNPGLGKCVSKPKCTYSDGSYATKEGIENGQLCHTKESCEAGYDNTRSYCDKGQYNNQGDCVNNGGTWYANVKDPGCNGPNEKASTWDGGMSPQPACDNMPEICQCDPEQEFKDNGGVDPENECTTARNGHPIGCAGIFKFDCIPWANCVTSAGDSITGNIPGAPPLGAGLYLPGSDWGRDEWSCTQACFKVENLEALTPANRQQRTNIDVKGATVGNLLETAPILAVDEDNEPTDLGAEGRKLINKSSLCSALEEKDYTGYLDGGSSGQRVPTWVGAVMYIDSTTGHPSPSQSTARVNGTQGNSFQGNDNGPYAEDCTWRNFRQPNGGWCKDKDTNAQALGLTGSHQYTREDQDQTFNTRAECEQVLVDETTINDDGSSVTKGVKRERSENPGLYGNFEWITKVWDPLCTREEPNTPGAVDPNKNNPGPGYINPVVALEGTCTDPQWTNRQDCVGMGEEWDQKKTAGSRDLKGFPKIPNTATIPVDLGDTQFVGFKGGPSSINIDNASGYYMATVTELRHASIGFDNYFNYLRVFQPFLPCYYCQAQGGKWCNYCPTEANIAMNGITPEQAAGWQNLAAMGNDKPMNPIEDGLSRGTDEREGQTEAGLVCGRKKIKWNEYEASGVTMQDVFKKVQDLANNFYGRKYLMPLPFNPPTVVGCANPWIETQAECEETRSTCLDDMGNIIHQKDDDGDYIVPFVPVTDETECGQRNGVFSEVGGFDWGAHGLLSEWFRKFGVGTCKKAAGSDEALPWVPDRAECEKRKGIWIDPLQSEQKWDIVGAGWPGEGYDPDWEASTWKNTSYPQDVNFWEGGNLAAFVAFPHKETRRLQGDKVDLNFGDIDPERMSNPDERTLTREELEKNEHKNNIHIGYSGKVFVRADVDPKTYWLKTRPMWELLHAKTYPIRSPKQRQPRQAPEFIKESRKLLTRDTLHKYIPRDEKWRADELTEFAFYKPYALITIPNAVRYGHVDYAMATDDMGEGEICVPLIHHKNSNCLQRGWARSSGTSPEIAAWQNLAAFGNDTLTHPMIAPDGSKSQIADAAYKPFYAGVPQQSTRYTWGPWAIGTGFGKTEYKQDTSLHPATFGSERELNRFALAQAKRALIQQQNTLETGTVSLAGLPTYFAGTQIKLTIADGTDANGNPAFKEVQGPYVTDVNVQIGSGGVTTTYNLTTARKFGDLSQRNEERIKNMEARMFENEKAFEDFIVRIRRDLLSETGQS